MSTPSIPAATSPFPDDCARAAKKAADEVVRSASLARQRDAAADDAQATRKADAAAAVRAQAPPVPDPMSSLSTVAILGAMTSLPAALSMLNSIAMASAAGTLSEADRQTLQSEYARLNALVVSAVGSVGAGQQAQTSTGHDDGGEQGDTPAPQETTRTRTVERTSTVQKQTLVEDGHAAQEEPRVDLRIHELHVGADCYEPAPIRQTVEHPTLPATLGHVEFHAETQHSLVTQFVQATQTQQTAPVLTEVA